MSFHRFRGSGRPARVWLAATTAAVVATLSLIAGPASASTPGPSSPPAPPGAIHVQMTLNCTTMTDSSLGAVTYRNLAVQYWGVDDSGGWPDQGWMASSSYASARSGNYVGRYGEAWALEQGTVTLWWGGQCTLLSPEDSTYMGS